MANDIKPTRIHKAKPKTKFVVMRNTDGQRDDISYEAKGLLLRLMSLPDDWDIHPKELENDHAKRQKIQRMLRELRDAGYVRLVRERDDDGKFTDTYYEVYGDPAENPDHDSDSPAGGKPVKRENRKAGKQHLQKKYGNKRKKKPIASGDAAGKKSLDRDHLFDAIAWIGFKIPIHNLTDEQAAHLREHGGRIGKVKKTLLIDNPQLADMTVDELKSHLNGFWKWLRPQMPDGFRLHDHEKWRDHYRAYYYRDAADTGNGASDTTRARALAELERLEQLKGQTNE